MNEREKWNRAADEFQRTAGNADSYTRRVLEYLGEKGALVKGERAADIGCGAGKYAVALAKLGMKLLLIDISDEMMAYTLQNIAPYAPEAEDFVGDFLTADIPNLGWEKSVYLSFASMSPPALCPEGIALMSRMSTKHCFLATFASRENLLFAELRQRLGLNTNAAAGRYDEEYLRLREAIRALGYEPELRFADHSWSDDLSPEVLTQNFFSGRMISFVEGEADEQEVRAILESMSDSRGLVHSETRAQAAWLYWTV